MCLGQIAQVVEVHGGGRAQVTTGGPPQVVLALDIEGPALAAGDWVVVHSGFALQRISDAEARDALSIRATPVERKEQVT